MTHPGYFDPKLGEDNPPELAPSLRDLGKRSPEGFMIHIDPVTGKVTNPVRDLIGGPPPSHLPRQVEPECGKSPTDKHEPDWGRASQPLGVGKKDSIIIHVVCKHCGRTGSFIVDPKIVW